MKTSQKIKYCSRKTENTKPKVSNEGWTLDYSSAEGVFVDRRTTEEYVGTHLYTAKYLRTTEEYVSTLLYTLKYPRTTEEYAGTHLYTAKYPRTTEEYVSTLLYTDGYPRTFAETHRYGFSQIDPFLALSCLFLSPTRSQRRRTSRAQRRLNILYVGYRTKPVFQQIKVGCVGCMIQIAVPLSFYTGLNQTETSVGSGMVSCSWSDTLV